MSALSGGDKLEKVLATTVAKLRNEHDTVRVGFLEGSTYPDGTSVPMVAAVQEFGGTITVPEHNQSVFRKVNKDGSFAKAGRFVKRTKANFQTDHTVPAFQVTIPSRPFFRNMLADVKPLLGPLIAKAMAKGMSPDQALQAVGEFMKGRLQKSIIDTNDPPLAESTVARKGFSKPLIETQHMQNSADYEVVKGTGSP